jgi:hypothetical protein
MMSKYIKLSYEEYTKKYNELNAHFPDTLGLYNDPESIRKDYEMYCIKHDAYIAGDDDGWFVQAVDIGGMYTFLYK